MATIPSHIQLQIPQPTSPVSSPMATTLSFSSLTPNNHCHLTICHHIRHRRAQNICYADNSTKNNISTKLESEKEPDNPLLKVAWYTSELLGIAASLFRSPPERKADSGNSVLAVDERGSVDRGLVVDSIKQDFQRSYFVTGNLTLDAYKEDCEFADPAGSFKGLRRFKRNCTNFGTLLDKSDMKLMKWEDFEDKGIGHWRFSCVLSFPWKPILSATGYTEYYFDQQSGKVCRHVEYWNVPKMALFKQMLRPSKNRSKGG